jgi:uncharacterized membrane protein (DUF106 family)
LIVLDDREIIEKFKDNERDHKQYEQYLTNDKKRLEKQDVILAEITKVTIKLTEQNTYQAKRIEQNEKLILDHIDKPSFWQSKNGTKLFWVLIITGLALVVAALGLNIFDLATILKP